MGRPAPYIVVVEYRTGVDTTTNTFGTFRSDAAAQRFVDEIDAWSATLYKDGEIVSVHANVYPLTKPLLEFVQEDVASLNVPGEIVSLGGDRGQG